MTSSFAANASVLTIDPTAPCRHTDHSINESHFKEIRDNPEWQPKNGWLIDRPVKRQTPIKLGPIVTIVPVSPAANDDQMTPGESNG